MNGVISYLSFFKGTDKLLLATHIEAQAAVQSAELNCEADKGFPYNISPNVFCDLSSFVYACRDSWARPIGKSHGLDFHTTAGPLEQSWGLFPRSFY
jgi:hypothetical protein